MDVARQATCKLLNAYAGVSAHKSRRFEEVLGLHVKTLQWMLAAHNEAAAVPWIDGHGMQPLAFCRVLTAHRKDRSSMAHSSIELATKRVRRDGESDAYAFARQALLAAEIDLQRRIDSVSEQRRALPDGPTIAVDYRFKNMNGTDVGLKDLFGSHDTLVTYFWMYGPERERPCPMCTNLLGPLNANAADLMQRVSLAVLGRSTVERQMAFAQERGWHALQFHQTVGDDFPRDFGGIDPATGYEWPVLAVFKKSAAGVVRLFWQGAMTGEMTEPGMDPRGGPDFAPLWTVLDLTPAGRGTDWYPKLAY